jgi:hypothetical protein
MTTALPNPRPSALLGGLLLVAAQVVGCARSRSADDDVNRAMDFARQRALASCEAIARCGCPGPNEAIRCRLSFDDADLLNAELISALEEGRVTFDQDAASRCLSATSETCPASADLAGFASPPGVCRSVYAGPVPAGGACTFDEECSGGARCAIESDAPDAVGRCEPRLDAGDACRFHDQCAARDSAVAQCLDDDGMPRCGASPVQADRGEDERCGTWFEDGRLQQAACSAMLRCAAGICVPKLPLGTQCSASSDCACGARCVFGSQGGCTPLEIRTQAGDSCGVLPELVAECDAERLACVDGVCRPKGDGSSGSVCDPQQAFGACDDGLGCSGGMCTPFSFPSAPP